LATPRDILWIAQTGQEAAYQTMLSEVLERQYQVKELDASEALKLCPILREDRLWKALLELDGYDLDVHAIHHGCLKALKQSGGKVFLNSEVHTMTLAEGTWEIRSSHGTFATRVVVNAAGAWADIVASRAGIRPLGFKALRRTALTFDAPAGADHAAWPFVYDIEEKFYFKLEHGQILASPADETELPACDVSYDDLDIAVAADRIQNVARIEISHVRNKWAGFRVFSPDRDLVIGEDDSAPGFYWLAGQGGVGIMTAPGAALALASMVEQRPLPASLTTLGLTQAMLSPTRFTNG
jgi:D-arginine dehydrogenase